MCCHHCLEHVRLGPHEETEKERVDKSKQVAAVLITAARAIEDARAEVSGELDRSPDE